MTTLRARRSIKAVLNVAALAIAFPFALTCWLEARLNPVGEVVFNLWAHVFALGPGLPGVYLRRALYSLVLERCSLDFAIGFGAFFSHRRAIVEEGVQIGPYAVVGTAHLGKGCLIGTRASLLSGCAQHEQLCDGSWSPSDVTRFTRIEIGNNVWIGEGALVMADVGAGTMVAAGAVVSSTVADNIVVAGNPARFVRKGVAHAAQIGAA